MDFEKFRENINIGAIFYARKDIEKVSAFIEKYKKSHPNASFKEIMENIENDSINKSNKYYECISELSGIPFQLLACNHLSSNENVLKNIYSKYKKKDISKINNDIYSYDLNKSCNLLVKSILSVLRSHNEKHTITKEQEYN